MISVCGNIRSKRPLFADTVKSSIRIRYLLSLFFLTTYIALGFLMHLEAITYLLLGIPLTLLFQIVIVKQPLHKLWLRDKEKFYLTKLGWVITGCFAAFPFYKLIDLITREPFAYLKIGYYLAALFGAFGAGYCYSNFRKNTVTDFLLCFGIAAILRMSFYFLPFVITSHEFDPDYLRGLMSLLTYIPVAFVVEEVVFRGMLDTYIHQSTTIKSLWSALYISCLWGLWHLPLLVDGKKPVWFVVLGAMTVSLWGIILSIFWRRTGNLAVPGFTHAFADAIRDSLK